MTIAIVPTPEPVPLMWEGREVEARDVTLRIAKEAEAFRTSGDHDGYLLHMLAHSLHYRETGQRVFQSVAQMRNELPFRVWGKLLALGLACTRYNAPDPNDIPEELRAKVGNEDPT